MVSTSHRQIISASIVFLIIGLAVGYVIGAVAVRSSVVEKVVTVTMTGRAPSVVEYCFTPVESCADVVTEWIGRANKSAHVLIYSFTLDIIAEALIAAKNRGVDVKIVMEAHNAFSIGSEYEHLRQAGVDVRLDSNSAEMHHKVAIIDQHIVLTGSFNWSMRANSENDENLVVIDDVVLAAVFEEQFQRVYSQAT